MDDKPAINVRKVELTRTQADALVDSAQPKRIGRPSKVEAVESLPDNIAMDGLDAEFAEALTVNEPPPAPPAAPVAPKTPVKAPPSEPKAIVKRAPRAKPVKLPTVKPAVYKNKIDSELLSSGSESEEIEEIETPEKRAVSAVARAPRSGFLTLRWQ